MLLRDVSVCHMESLPRTICGKPPPLGETLGQTVHRTGDQRCWGSLSKRKEVVWMRLTAQGKDQGKRSLEAELTLNDDFGTSEVSVVAQILAYARTLMLVL